MKFSIYLIQNVYSNSIWIRVFKICKIMNVFKIIDCNYFRTFYNENKFLIKLEQLSDLLFSNLGLISLLAINF